MSKATLGRASVALAFALLPVIFAIQVLAMSPLPALLIPALFIIAVLLLRVRPDARFGLVDIAVFIFLLMSFVSSVVSIAQQKVGLNGTVSSWMFIVTGMMVYILFSRALSARESRNIMACFVFSSIFVAVYWIFDTVMRNKFEVAGWFNERTAQYILMRSGSTFDQLNKSVISVWSRSYGLQDRHTTAGVIIGIAGIVTMAMLWRLNLALRWMILGLTGWVLFLGMATLAFLSFVVVAPVAAAREAIGRYRWVSIAYALAATIALLYTLNFLTTSHGPTEDMVVNSTNIFKVQTSYASNLDGGEAPVSWYAIYKNASIEFIDYVAHHPFVIIFGEGFSPVDNGYPRGGDVAFYEVLAAFGLPAVVFLVIAALWAIVNAWSRYGRDYAALERVLIVVAVAILMLSAMSTLHYGTVFNRAVIPLIFASLGIIGKYSTHVRGAADR